MRTGACTSALLSPLQHMPLLTLPAPHGQLHACKVACVGAMQQLLVAVNRAHQSVEPLPVHCDARSGTSLEQSWCMDRKGGNLCQSWQAKHHNCLPSTVRDLAHHTEGRRM